jgi:hypothetical protein
MKWLDISASAAVRVAARAARVKALVVAVLSAVALAGCGGDDGVDPLADPGLSLTEQQRVYNQWRVEMITGSLPHSEMLAEYNYDERGRLSRANLTERNTWQNTGVQYRESFEWKNGRIVNQLTMMTYIDPTRSGEPIRQEAKTPYLYNEDGRLVAPEGRQYLYDERWRLVQTYSYKIEETTYADRLEWDELGNVIKHIRRAPELNEFGEPIPGSMRERVYEYEYDNHPKPNFGLGEAFFWDGRYSPWPATGGNAGEQMARTLSRNNLTRCEASGYGYRYTYNEEGLPATVQQVWIGPSRGPNTTSAQDMVQTIVYKRINY